MKHLFTLAAVAAAAGVVALPRAGAVNGFYTWTYPSGQGTVRAIDPAGLAVGDLPMSGGPVIWDSAGTHVVPSTSTGAALDVSDTGVVVGYRNDWTAFRWTAAGGVVDLGRGWARAVNSSGVAVGDDTVHPVVWWPDGTQTDLFAGSADHGVATDVNDAGEVVGVGTRDDGTSYVFAWTQADGVIQIAPFPANASPRAVVNASGTVASTYILNGNARGFVWDRDHGLTDLGALVPNGPTVVADMNDSGTVVGYSYGPSSPVPAQHVFKWTRDTGIVDLGTLGGRRGFATAINEAGDIAGYAQRAGSATYNAFVWTPTLGMQDLGFTQESEAYAIGDNGWVGGSIGPSNAPSPIIWQPRQVDTTPPTVVTPDSVTAEATSAAGAIVTFTVTATDNVTATPSLVCDPVSGSLFPLGDTTVQCTSRDDAGNETEASFVVHVVDTTPPSLTLPSPAVDATSPLGATVAYQATATDTVDATPAVVCVPPSGTTFDIGDTSVSCTARDASGNETTGSFVVHVRSAAEQLTRLTEAVTMLELPHGIENSLLVKLRAGQLAAFVHEVAAQSDKAIAAAAADDLISRAQRLEAVLG